MADETARSASSFASARKRGTPDARHSRTQERGDQIGVRVSTRFAKTFDGAINLLREDAGQALDVEVSRDQRQPVRADDESGESANAGHPVEQHARKHSGNALRHVLRR